MSVLSKSKFGLSTIVRETPDFKLEVTNLYQSNGLQIYLKSDSLSVSRSESSMSKYLFQHFSSLYAQTSVQTILPLLCGLVYLAATINKGENGTWYRWEGQHIRDKVSIFVTNPAIACR